MVGSIRKSVMYNIRIHAYVCMYREISHVNTLYAYTYTYNTQEGTKTIFIFS